MARSLVAITGASSGIGAEFARKLAPEHDLLLIARRKDRLEQLSEELKSKYDCSADVMEADLATSEDSARVAERIGSDERLVMLVNNAGFGTKGLFWKAPLEDSERMHRLHVIATVRLTHAALRNLTRKNMGAVINVASVSAWIRGAGSISYSATKSWMAVFTEGLYLELRSSGSNVVVQALCPGFTVTEFHDAMAVDRKRLAGSAFWMSAEEVVQASLDGLRDRKLFVIPGWRYRILVTLLSKLPARLRLAAEEYGARRRQRALGMTPGEVKQLDRG